MEKKPPTDAFEVRRSIWRTLTKRPAWYVYDIKNEAVHPSTINKVDHNLRYYRTEWGAASYCNTMNKLAASGGI